MFRLENDVILYKKIIYENYEITLYPQICLFELTSKINYRYKIRKKWQAYVDKIYRCKKMKNLQSSLSSFLSLIQKGVQGHKCMLSRKHRKKLHISLILLNTVF